RRLGLPADHPVLDRLAWAGLFSPAPIGTTRASRLDVLCALLSARMGYAPGDRDLVVLEHRIGIIGGDGRTRTIVSTLLAHGEARGATAMARTVPLPAAAAASLSPDGPIRLTGRRITL